MSIFITLPLLLDVSELSLNQAAPHLVLHEHALAASSPSCSLLEGRIDIFVPSLYLEGQIHSSTSKMINLIPQLLFLG